MEPGVSSGIGRRYPAGIRAPARVTRVLNVLNGLST